MSQPYLVASPVSPTAMLQHFRITDLVQPGNSNYVNGRGVSSSLYSSVCHNPMPNSNDFTTAYIQETDDAHIVSEIGIESSIYKLLRFTAGQFLSLVITPETYITSKTLGVIAGYASKWINVIGKHMCIGIYVSLVIDTIEGLQMNRTPYSKESVMREHSRILTYVRDKYNGEVLKIDRGISGDIMSVLFLIGQTDIDQNMIADIVVEFSKWNDGSIGLANKVSSLKLREIMRRLVNRV